MNPFHTLSQETMGLILLLLSAMLLSSMGVFLKKAAAYDIPSTELVFFRAIFQGSFVLLGMFHFKEERKQEQQHQQQQHQQQDKTNEDASLFCEQYSQQQYEPDLLIRYPFGRTKFEQKVVLFRGIVGACGFICAFYSFKSLPLGDSICVFSMYPVYTIFMGKFFLDEPIRWIHLFASFLSVIGAVLITGPSFLFSQEDEVPHDDQYNPMGYIAALFGGVFAAAVFIFIRKAGKLGLHTLQLLSSWSMFGAILSLVFGMTLFKPLEGSWIVPPSGVAYWYIFAYCFIGSIAHFLLNYAGRFCNAGVGSIVRSSDILWAYFYQVYLFDETPHLSTIVGVLFIIVSLTMIAVDKIKSDQTQTTKYNTVDEEQDDELKLEIVNMTMDMDNDDDTVANVQ